MVVVPQSAERSNEGVFEIVDILAETGPRRFGFVEVCLVSIWDWLLDCELKAAECEMKARWDARWNPWGSGARVRHGGGYYGSDSDEMEGNCEESWKTICGRKDAKGIARRSRSRSRSMR